ncbi:DUF956 family protein [Granulicatella seriolae]|uniref:DUF956 family protein n=1 Tax=Granulicatella seriolae TaxID=2967226 RepID=A0ABT1WMC6_9LACT|nr:DUF956 family protein [Granulicatella seriolae]
MAAYQPLNSQIIYSGKANNLSSALNATVGTIEFGDKGLEFRSSQSSFFMQIPYQSIQKVYPHKLLWFWLRGFKIVAEGQVFTYVVANAKTVYPLFLETLRTYRKKK